MKISNYQLNLLVCVLLAFHVVVCTACPKGYKSRGETCCKPLTCGKGWGYQFCTGTKEHPGEDSCFKCPDGTYNQDIVNTEEFDFVVDVCRRPDCSCYDEESMITNLEECQQGQSKICVCNRVKLFYGKDPKSCKRADQTIVPRIKRKGFELTDRGTVEPCDTGYFKAEADLSTCTKHTRCPEGHIVKEKGTAKSDVVCEEVFITVKNISVDKDENGNQNVTKKPEEATSPQETSHWHILVILAVLLVFVVLMSSLIIIICVCVRKNPEKFHWICSMRGLKARLCKRSNHTKEDTRIYSEIESGITSAEQSDQIDPLMDNNNDQDSMPTYVQATNLIIPNSVTSVDETVHDNDDEHTDTFVKTPGSSFSASCQNRPVALVSPSIRTESIDDRGARLNSRSEQNESLGFPSSVWSEDINDSEGGPIMSPQQNDRGQLVPAGQRVREEPDHYGDQHDQQLDSGVVEGI